MFPPDAVFHLERKDDELKQNVMRILRTSVKLSLGMGKGKHCLISRGRMMQQTKT